MSALVTTNQLPQICLGYIRGTMVHARFAEALLETVVYDVGFMNVIRNRVAAQYCSHYFNLGRNKLAARICDEYAGHCDVFVSLDTDHVFTPHQIMELVSYVTDDRPVVSGLYYAADDDGNQVRPIMLRRRADGTAETMWQFPRNELVEVDVVGMGFCAMKMSVLTEMRREIGDAWYDFSETSTGRFMIEDDAFCRRVQEYLGKPIYVHTGIVPGHLKTCELTDRNERRVVA